MLDDPDEIDMSEADHVAWVRRKAMPAISVALCSNRVP
jgi:hypothetical protein